MSDDKAAGLRAQLSGMPDTLRVIEAVLAAWPEHAAYLAKSFEPRSPAMLQATEAASGAALKLIGGHAAQFAADYRWTCDRLRDEELFFHREGRYRLSTFADANAEVYSDSEYMGRYVNGLLLTPGALVQATSRRLRCSSTRSSAPPRPFDYLEVGPGHGLMVYFAARAPLSRSLEAWDVSAVLAARDPARRSTPWASPSPCPWSRPTSCRPCGPTRPST